MNGRSFWQCSIALTFLLPWPALAAAKPKPAKFASGLNHSLTIRADGSLYAWGGNGGGQLGLGNPKIQT